MLDITFHWDTGLQIHQICFRLKTFGALWLQLFMLAHSRRHQRHLSVVFGNLGDQFLWSPCKISSIRCLTDWRLSSETKETLFHTNTEPMHCLEVTLSLCYCAIFGRCNIIEYYTCCWAAICIILPSNDFYWLHLSNDIKFAHLRSLQHISWKSLMMMHVTL